MRMVICVKQVYDPKSVKISRSREEFDLRDAVKILNPADKYALEAALCLRESVGGEVIALTVGDAGAEDVAREAVAIGADRAMLVTGSWKLETGNWKLETGKDVSAPASSLRPDSGQGFQPPAASFQLLASNAVTRLLAAAIVRLGEVDLALTGELGATDGTGGLAPRLAAALGWPVTLDAVGLSQNEDGLWAVVGPADARFVPIVQPAVVAIVPGPERPRYPHPRRIANAWNEGLVEFLTPADLGLTPDALTPDTEPGSLILGPERVRGQVVGGAIGEAAKTVVGMLRAKRVI